MTDEGELGAEGLEEEERTGKTDPNQISRYVVTLVGVDGVLEVVGAYVGRVIGLLGRAEQR